MHFSVISLFPEYFAQPLRTGVVGQCFERGVLSCTHINPREFSEAVHRAVDDRPFGGGDGMVMQAEPLARAIERAKADPPGARARVINFSPQGRPLTQSLLREYAGLEHLILICGRYAGVDERLVNELVDEEVSIGDFVLSGGEPAPLRDRRSEPTAPQYFGKPRFG
jgi:tRNA (guanine37-N1)-methyltransferase